jgi:uncharacterized SAM-dependent methyltransferase
LYLNGVAVDDADDAAGSYTAMHNNNLSVNFNQRDGLDFKDNVVVHTAVYSDEKNAQFFF